MGTLRALSIRSILCESLPYETTDATPRVCVCVWHIWKCLPHYLYDTYGNIAMHLVCLYDTSGPLFCGFPVRLEPDRINSDSSRARLREVRQVARNCADVGPGQGRRVRLMDQQLQRPGDQDGGGSPLQEELVRLENVQDIEHQG